MRSPSPSGRSYFICYLARVTSHVSLLTSHVLRRIDAGLILAALLTLFIIQSLLQPGLPTLADLPIHLYRTLEYGQVRASGVVVARWAFRSKQRSSY
jgi:hypothetical protein